MNIFFKPLMIAALLALPTAARAEPTDIAVRVLARGAKFIAGHDASVRITLSDAENGEILARGMTQGGTGNTERIMKDAHRRPMTLSTADAALFETTLDLDRATLVTVTAEGPLNQPQALTEVSSTQWIFPGKDVTAGDGWLLELPGLIVDLLDPPAHSRPKAGEQLTLRANVAMMCGCGLSKGGLWDANKTEVEAQFRRNGEDLGAVPLAYSAESGLFEARYTPDAAGTLEIELRAWMAETNNGGLDRAAVFVGD